MADLFAKDIRSGMDQHRYRKSASKWKYSGPSNSWPSIPTLDSEAEIPKKHKPLKAHWRQPHGSSNHNKGIVKTSNSHSWQAHSSRVAAATFAKLEARDSDTDIDLSPRGSETMGNIDDIYYSFDADASPVSSLGFDSLIDVAQANFQAKQTDKLVKDEYEVLDGEGESVKKGKRKGKNHLKPTLNTNSDFYDHDDVDGEWETI